MKRIFATLLLCCISHAFILSQEYLLLDNQLTNIYEREIYQQKGFFTSIQPFLISEIQKKQKVDSVFMKKSAWGLPFERIRYHRQKEKWSFRVQPVLTAKTGYELQSKQMLSNINAGFRIQSTIGSKMALYFGIAYATRNYPDYIINPPDSMKAMPKTDIIPHFGKPVSHNGNRYSYIIPDGYLSLSPQKYLNFQLGYGKNFWGDGYRSLLLSDNANSYPFLKTMVTVWRIKYVCIFTALRDLDFAFHENNETPECYSSDCLSGKFSSMHYLSINLTKRLQVNLFEGVFWSSRDSVGHRGFDINYLNPVIFYRPIEFSVGSPDNAIIGMAMRWKVLNNFYFYGQCILDEFIFKEVVNQTGWWGNKFGFQAGMKYFNVAGIKNLRLQTEWNYVRPYTYSHQSTLQNVGHYYQPLAHPLGANFSESILIMRYQRSRFILSNRLIYARYGMDKDNWNVGHDIYKSYKTRNIGRADTEYGHETGQGVETSLVYNSLKLSYLLNIKVPVFLEAGAIIRKCTNENYSDKFNYFYLSLRTGFLNNSLDF